MTTKKLKAILTNNSVENHTYLTSFLLGFKTFMTDIKYYDTADSSSPEAQAESLGYAGARKYALRALSQHYADIKHHSLEDVHHDNPRSFKQLAIDLKRHQWLLNYKYLGYQYITSIVTSYKFYNREQPTNKWVLFTKSGVIKAGKHVPKNIKHLIHRYAHNQALLRPDKRRSD